MMWTANWSVLPTLQRRTLLGAVLGTAVAAALLATATIAWHEPRILVAALTLTLILPVLRLSDATAIQLLIVVLAVQGFPAYFTGYFPAGTLFIDDAIALTLVLRWTLRTLAGGLYLRTIGAVGPLLAVLAGYVGVAMLVQQETPWQSELFAAWQLAYLWPLGFILASVVDSEEEARRLVTFVWRLAWVQVAVVALQWPILYAAGYFTAIPPVDWFGGTLGKGSAHILGIWIGMVTLTAIALWIQGVIGRRQALLAIAAFLFVLISGSTRQMYVVLPAAIAVLMAVSPLRFGARALLIVLVPLLMLGFFRVYSRATQMSFSVENLLLKQQQNTRLAFYTYSWQVASEHDTVWFGLGPGSYAGTAGLRYGAPHAKLAAQQFPHDANMVSATQWPVLFVEIGVAGLALVLAVFGALAWRMLRISRRAREPLTRGLALAGLGALVVLIATGFGSRTLEYQLPSLHVWLLCGLAAALYGRELQAARPERPRG
jgi:O-antigen ligase